MNSVFGCFMIRVLFRNKFKWKISNFDEITFSKKKKKREENRGVLEDLVEGGREEELKMEMIYMQSKKFIILPFFFVFEYRFSLNLILFLENVYFQQNI